jgi:predicted nucleic acid-binding protein
MRVYPDSSFLVSWLYARDTNHGRAAQWFASHQTDEWVISAWAEFETINTLRGLVLHSPGPSAASMEARRRYFKHLFHAGPLTRAAVDWFEALKE